MALSNFLEEITPSAEVVVPEKSQSHNNSQTAEKVQTDTECLTIVGDNSENGETV